MVRTQRDRNRVSSMNSPWFSVGVASMSPRRSLTTKALPSRMLTVLSAIAQVSLPSNGVCTNGDPARRPRITFAPNARSPR